MATVSCHHALASLGGAVRRGFSRDELLKEAGINPALTALANARITDDQMTALVQLIWTKLDDEFMGFTATPCKRGTFSFMLHMVRSSFSVRDALKQGMRFYQLVTEDIDTNLEEDDEKATITIKFRQAELDERSFYQEFWMIIWHRLASWLSGVSIPLIETRFAQARPEHSLELMIMFPSAHIFDAKENALVFPAEYLNNSLIREKNEIEQFLINSPYNLITIPGHDQSLRSRVEKRLKCAFADNQQFPVLSDVADQLCMTQQTLHRRLKEEGTGYQKIKDSIRRDEALMLLTRERRALTEVAEKVGFADARSFTRAFKNWTGMTPRAYCRFIK